jgi:hypothetical protein
MFNDLTGAPSQAASKVDDIFADTDNSQAAGGNSQVETRRVGLSANPSPLSSQTSSGQKMAGSIADEDEEEATSGKGGKWFKIAIIAVVAAIVILGGYLVYTKLLAKKTVEPVVNNQATTQTSNQTTNKPTENVVPPVATSNNSFVTPLAEQNAATSSEASSTVEVPAIPGVNAPANTDSDLDGLTDEEEKTLGTNPNLIDSDFDTLSDYDEVKVYKTDPLKSDSDGDTYSDDAEIKSGYNPNGPGKLVQ